MSFRFNDPSNSFSKYIVKNFFIGWVSYYENTPPRSLTVGSENFLINVTDSGGTGTFTSTERSIRSNNSPFEIRAQDTCADRNFTTLTECNLLVSPFTYYT
jgi:hypothetical protein